jgi:uncharacterized membrane protein AbrB (regulator of aidB expression)
MANLINNSVSKVKNNPIATIIGGVATYYILTKKYPQAKVVTNKYMLVGVIVLGGFVGAYLSGQYKKSTL